MKIYLIRHGRTKGNSEGRYVGRTDEPLLAQAEEELREKGLFLQKIPEPDVLYVSPLRRCRETARLLFPGKEQQVVEAFRECDFGAFEYRNYQELNGNPDYQRYIDSGGVCGFPGGESLREFQERCVEGLCGVAGCAWERKRDMCLALVVHGGTIMALLDRFSRPHRDYFEWQTGNGDGYAAELLYHEGSGELTLEHIVDLQELLRG